MSPLLPSARARLPLEQWKPASPVILCGPDCRSPEHLRQVVRQFDVERETRYRRVPPSPQFPRGKTFCNIFVWDVSLALEAEIPHAHPAFGSEVVHGFEGWAELNAFGALRWLKQWGPAHDWTPCDEAAARASAAAGRPTVATWTNPDPLHSSHIALVLPTAPLDREPRIAQAGRVNLFDAPLSLGFGGARPVEYFTHP